MTKSQQIRHSTTSVPERYTSRDEADKMNGSRYASHRQTDRQRFVELVDKKHI